MPKLLKYEIVVYALIGFLAAIGTYGSWGLGLGNLGEMGPGLFPFLANLSVLITIIALFIISLFRLPSKEIDKSPSSQPQPKGWGRPIIILISLAIWPVLVNLIGYVLSSFLTSLPIAKAVGYKGWGKPIIFCASISLSIWLIFGFVFDVDLPAGFSF